MHPDYNGSYGFPRWYRSLQLLLIAVVMLASVSPALAVDLSYTFGGDAVWFTQTAITHGGTNAYQSGAISNSQSSWMETTVTGPGAIRFWWKVSSESCCDPLRFSIDGTSQADIRGEVGWQSRAFAVPAGSHALRWSYSTDGSVLSGSNAGWVDQISYTPGSNIDVTSPVTSATPAAGIYATSQSVALACVDNAGCTGTYYCLGSNCNPTTPYSGPITVSTAADLRFFSTDAAGNNELVKTASYSFDTTPPVSNSNPGAGTYSGSRYVTLYCGDSGTGCAATYYCLGSGCTPSALYSSPVQITSTSDLRYYSTDRSGNRESIKTSSYTITPDTTPPTTTPSNPSGTYRDSYVYLSCSDGNGSGCAATYYCLGAGCTPSLSFTGFLNISSSTDLRYYSQDNSGNSESVKTASYIIDTTPPVTNVTPRGGIYSSPQSASLVCSDGSGSGCSATYYCLGKGCSPNIAYNGTISISSSTDLNYYSSDSAYNYELIKSERYTILTAPPTTIKVPADRLTIQAAIDAARDGDTVLVAPGTYMEMINFRGKVITVVSSGGADNTIIDGNNTGTVVTFTSGEMRSTVLDGFTIRNGNAVGGVASNGYGGGIYISYASPTIINNRISANTASWGAGIYEGFGSPLIQGNIITNNISNSYGGGISIGGAAAAEIVGNIISNNSSEDGGGISMWDAGVPIIKDNTIRDNVASGSGGGISMVNWSDATIIQNVFINNVANTGSAIHWLAPSGSRGPFLANNTIVDASSSQGSVIYADGYDANTILVNNIIAATGNKTAVYCGNLNDINPPKFSNNVVYSRSGDAYGGYCADQNGINGNITSDPQLNSASFGYCGLRAGSPAIDAGDNNVPNLPATDLNGISRSIAGLSQGVARVDVGAYEYDPAEPRATLGNLPGGVTRETSVSITVDGAGIISYRYALDGGPFSTIDTPVATPIVLTGVAGGTHAVAVIGRSLTRLQSVSSATVSEWTIDTAPPVTTVSPAGGSYTAPQAVTLACNDGSGSGCAATFYCLGGGCTPDTPYSGPIAVTSTSGLRYFSRDLFGNQEAIKTASYTFSGTVSGRVTDSGTGNGIQNVNVNVFNIATGLWAGYAYTDSSGAYKFSGLASGSYKLYFNSGNYVEQWYSGKNDWTAATVVTLSAPGSITDVNVIMVKGGTITGTVTDKDSGLGIPGVNVYAYDAATGYIHYSGTTNDSGNYQIFGIAGGTYKLRFSNQYLSGYLEQWYSGKTGLSSATPVTVTNAAITSGINAAMLKGGRITGKVTDSVSGSPIPQVYVTAVDAVSGEFISTGATDSSGVYTITGLSGGYKLRFSADGYLDQWYDRKTSQATATIVTVTAPGTVAGINMAMPKGGNITGIVTDNATGTGIQNVYVSVFNSLTGELGSSGYTDSSGAYRISGLPTGNYKLSFSASDYINQWLGGKPNPPATTSTALPDATNVAVTAPNTTTGINMAMLKGSRITGTVTDKVTGTPLWDINVSVYNAVTGAWAGSGYTDNSGGFRISGLVSGGYKIRFSSYSNTGYVAQWYGNKNQQSTATVVNVIASETVTGINAALETGAIITGTVTDKVSGAPIQGILVNAVSSDSGMFAGYGYTDSSGAYRVTGLASGNYKLQFSGNGYVSQWFDDKAGQALATAVSVTAPNTVADINVLLTRGGSISGTISDRISGVGIVSVSLSVIDRSSGEWLGGGTSDSNGNYTITGLASGSYSLRIYPAYGSGYLEKWYGGQDGYLCADSVTVTAPNATTGIDALLDMGGSVSGRVTDAVTGAGISGLRIFLLNIASQSTNSFNTAIDATGAYTVSGVPGGEYSLYLSAPGYIGSFGSTVVRITAPTLLTGVDGTLVKGGGISGRITDSSAGNGVGGVMVRAMDILTRSTLGSTTSDYNGNYTIDGLPNGSYSLYYDGGNVGLGTPARSGLVSRMEAEVSATPVPITAVPTTPYADLTTTTPTPFVPLSRNGFSTQIISVSPIYSATTGTPVPLAHPVSVVAPQITSGVDFNFVRMGSISGRVTDNISGEPINNVFVSAIDNITGTRTASAFSGSDGIYRISGVPSGTYRVQYSASNSANGGYLSKWYGSNNTPAVPGVVTVLAPEVTTGIDAQLARGGGISGLISVNSCPAPQQVNIRAYDAASGNLVGQAWVSTGYSARFTILALPAGNYKLSIIPAEAGFIRQWYPNKVEAASAEPITVTSGNITSGINVTLATGGGSISGKVSGVGVCSLIPASVKLYDWYSGALVADTMTNHDGNFQLAGLPDSSYKLLFTVNQLDRWYRVAGDTAQASPIVVSGGTAVTGINLVEGCSSDLLPLTLMDALRALRVAVGLEPVTQEILTRSDLAPVINGVSMPDGKIDIGDAIAILMKITSVPAVTAP